ncbi:MAG TPA: hypothetical protein PLA19_03695 [Candidatus Pacearchaeota archaeon]|nr:hypothetical protein [Candidatus Pacearchaeota archaeon]
MTLLLLNDKKRKIMPANGKVFAMTKKRSCLRFFVIAARITYPP